MPHRFRRGLTIGLLLQPARDVAPLGWAAHRTPIGGNAAPAIVYSNPLPHVLILTAIVVGVATTAVALALAIRIYEAYGTIEDDEIRQIDLGDTES